MDGRVTPPLIAIGLRAIFPEGVTWAKGCMVNHVHVERGSTHGLYDNNASMIL